MRVWTREDPFGILGSGADQPVTVLFGAVDVSSAVRNSTINNALNEIASANVVLDASAPAVGIIDFSAPVIIARGGVGERLFTGSAVQASSVGDELHVSCSSGPELREPLSGARVSRVGALQAMYALLRDSGFPDDRMQIQGLDDLPLQVVEVIAPVEGLGLDRRVRLGSVTFLPSGGVTAIGASLGPHELIDDFVGRETFAVTYVTTARLAAAERAGLRQIDAAIAWSNVRLRYAGGAMPDGGRRDWDRTNLRRVATRSDMVAVRGMSTGEVWLRQLRPKPTTAVTLAAGGHTEAAVAVGRRADTGIRAAVGAAARAATSTDALTRITSISEALEFYVGKTHVPALFTKAELKQLRNSAKALSGDKRERVNAMIGNLNTPPLLARLRYRLAQDAVPVSEDEVDVLVRVRGRRNGLVHGKCDDAVDDDLDHAVALLSRILLYAVHAETRKLRWE